MPFLRLLLCLIVLTAAGCGGPRNGLVAGRVLLDGKPLAGAMVVFTPESGVGAAGITREDGTYELTSRKLGDGVRVGRCGIRIEPADPTTRPLPIPAKYRDFQKSGLSFEVHPGRNECNLELSSR